MYSLKKTREGVTPSQKNSKVVVQLMGVKMNGVNPTT